MCLKVVHVQAIASGVGLLLMGMPELHLAQIILNEHRDVKKYDRTLQTPVRRKLAGIKC